MRQRNAVRIQGSMDVRSGAAKTQIEGTISTAKREFDDMPLKEMAIRLRAALTAP
jgi:hypothetical protein